jgi:hypothetical protein
VMMAQRRGGLLGAALAALTVAAAAGCADPSPAEERPLTIDHRPAVADHQLIERLFRETGAETKVSGPSWREYGSVVAAAIAERIDAFFSKLRIRQALWPRVLAWVLLALVLAMLAVILVRALARLWARRHSRPRETGAVVLVDGGTAAQEGRSRDAWRAEIEARLALQQIDAALEAVWWWFARSLTERAIDPAWTSRELLEAAQRGELRPQAAALDRMIYGPTRPGPHEVRHFVRRLEAALS